VHILGCCTEVKPHDRSWSTLPCGSPACGGECRTHVETCLTYNSVQNVVEARVLSQTNPCEICGGQSDTETPFSRSTCVLPCHYHSTNAPYSSRPNILRNRRTSGRGLRTFEQNDAFQHCVSFQRFGITNRYFYKNWSF
jgi:hypothetical protein